MRQRNFQLDHDKLMVLKELQAKERAMEVNGKSVSSNPSRIYPSTRDRIDRVLRSTPPKQVTKIRSQRFDRLLSRSPRRQPLEWNGNSNWSGDGNTDVFKVEYVSNMRLSQCIHKSQIRQQNLEPLALRTTAEVQTRVERRPDSLPELRQSGTTKLKSTKNEDEKKK